MIETYTRTWGGAADILFPFERGGLPPSFLRVLELFDADRLAYYLPSLRDLQMSDPKAFEDWLDREAQNWAKTAGVTIDEARKRLSDPDFISQPDSNWRPSDALCEQLLARTSPFNYAGDPFGQVLLADSEAPYPFNEVADLEDAYGREVLLPDASMWGDDLALLVALRFGALAPSHESDLALRSIPVARVAVTESALASLLDAAWTGSSSIYSTEWDGCSELSPLRATEVSCGWLYPRLGNWSERPFYVVAGDTLSDFCLALALDRLLGGCAWLPSSLSGQTSDVGKAGLHALASTVARLNGYGQMKRPCILTSMSLSLKSLGQIRTDTASMWLNAKEFLAWMKPKPVKNIDLPTLPQRLNDHAWGLTQYQPFVAGEQQTAIETPMPSTAKLRRDQVVRPGRSRALTWQVDIEVQRYQLPKRAALAELLLANPDTIDREIRVGGEGVSYFSQTAFVERSSRIEHTLVRPTLRLPSTLEAFQALLQRDQWSAQPSDKGRFASALLDALGGLGETATALRDPPTWAVLKAFLGGGPSSEEKGVRLRAGLDAVGSARTFLNLKQASVAAHSDEATVIKLLESLVASGVLSRGWVLKCSECLFAGWYALEQVGSTFSCQRCGRIARLDSQAWKEIPEPVFYYNLSEVIYQALKANSHATVFALASLREKSRTFLFCPELKVSRDSESHELDLWAIRDGRVIVGEAKTTNRLATQSGAERRAIAKTIQIATAASADDVVFATTAVTWRDATKAQIHEELKGSSLGLRMLEGLA